MTSQHFGTEEGWEDWGDWGEQNNNNNLKSQAQQTQPVQVSCITWLNECHANTFTLAFLATKFHPAASTADIECSNLFSIRIFTNPTGSNNCSNIEPSFNQSTTVCRLTSAVFQQSQHQR